jgi:AAA+ ATPase superfamily predicted ATPase
LNPFHYGKIVFGSDFCPRAEEAQFREGFENNKIILLTGKPKIGKTSLVKHVISQYPQTNFLVHVDLKLIESLADVERRLVLSLIESEVQTTPFKQVLIKYQKYNPSIKVDATNDDISFSVPTRTGVTSFAVIDLLRNFLKENNGKYPVLFLDNIQGLLSLEDKEFITMLSEYISSTRKLDMYCLKVLICLVKLKSPYSLTLLMKTL